MDARLPRSAVGDGFPGVPAWRAALVVLVLICQLLALLPIPVGTSEVSQVAEDRRASRGNLRRIRRLHSMN